MSPEGALRVCACEEEEEKLLSIPGNGSLRVLVRLLGAEGHAAYGEVWAPIANEIDRMEPERLVIVPDDILWYLPFEAFVTQSLLCITLLIKRYPF